MDPNRVDQIATAAERLFSTRGYHATTVRQVARALDLQGGSLYAHIDSKEDVLFAVVERAARAFRAAIAPVAASEAPPPDRLRAAVRAHIGVITANLPAATVYFHDWRYLSEPRRSEVRTRRNAYEAVWREIIADGSARGDFAVDDPAIATIACLSVCNWIYQWYDPDGTLDPNALADTFSTLLLGGLRAGRMTAEPVPHAATAHTT